METIRDTLRHVMRGLEAKNIKSRYYRPEHLLKKSLTKKEARHIRFNYFRKGILSINVDSAGWLYSLTLKKKDLLARLNKKSKAIKDIWFRIGEIR